MSKKLGSKPGQMNFLVGTELWSQIDKTLPELRRYLTQPSRGLISLKCAWRGEGDWLAIAKRYTDEGVVQVCFGSGTDFVSSLIGLEVAMDNDKWRPDKWLNK
jgi:hypothetical protein